MSRWALAPVFRWSRKALCPTYLHEPMCCSPGFPKSRVTLHFSFSNRHSPFSILQSPVSSLQSPVQEPRTKNQRTPKSPTTLPFRFRPSSEWILRVNPRFVGCVTVGSTYANALNRESLKPQFSAIKIGKEDHSGVTHRDEVCSKPMSQGH